MGNTFVYIVYTNGWLLNFGRNMLVSSEVPGYQVSASLPSANESENDAGEVLGVVWLFLKYPSSNLSLLEILPACSQKSTRLMEIIKKTELAPRE